MSTHPSPKRDRLFDVDCARIERQILARAASRKFTDPDALRQWIRIEFGLASRAPRLPLGRSGWLEKTSTGRRIVVNANLPTYRQVHVIVHELAEWLARRDHPGLWDEDARPCYDGDLTDRRHRIAAAVEASVCSAWGVDDHTARLSWYEFAKINAPADAIKYGRPVPEIESAGQQW